MPVKTEKQQAEEAREAAMEDWSNAVLKLHNEGRLQKIISKYDVGKSLRNLPAGLGKGIADSLMNRELESARSRSDVNMDPLESSFTLRSYRNLPIQATYEIARSTFSPEFVKKMEEVSPQIADSVSEKLNQAIEFKLASRVKHLVNKNPKINKLIREWASVDAVDDEQRAKIEDVKRESLYKSIMNSPEFPQYAAFVKDALMSKKVKAKESLFSPLVHNFKTINNWIASEISQNTGEDATGIDISKVPGMFISGQDYEPGEVPNAGNQKAIAEFMKSRKGKIDMNFGKWRGYKEQEAQIKQKSPNFKAPSFFDNDKVFNVGEID